MKARGLAPRTGRTAAAGRGHPTEAGFTIVEVAIAVGLLSMIMLVFTLSLATSLRALRTARLTQQATSLTNLATEAARDADYDGLAMSRPDLDGDPRVLGADTFDPDEGGPLAPEPLVIASAGGTLVPHIRTETVGGRAFTVAQYATWVDQSAQGGSRQDVKRLTIVVSWTADGASRDQRFSTLISPVARGLGIPRFELTPPALARSVQAGNQVVFAHTVRNLGLVDTYDVQMPSPPGRAWNVAFYRDVNADGQVDAGDTPLGDTNANGIGDTGSVPTDGTVAFLATWTLSQTESPGAETMTLTATSGASSSVSKTAVDTVTVTGTSIGLQLWHHNRPTPPTGGTVTQSDLAMNETAPTGSTLHAYSTNLTTGQGRLVKAGSATADSSDTTQTANWVYQLANKTTFEGQVGVRLYVASAGFSCSNAVTFTVHLRSRQNLNTQGGTTLAGHTFTLPPGPGPTCTFQQVDLSIGLSRVTIQQNRYLEAKVTVGGATDAILAYDTTTQAAWTSWPQVAS